MGGFVGQFVTLSLICCWVWIFVNLDDKWKTGKSLYRLEWMKVGFFLSKFQEILFRNVANWVISSLTQSHWTCLPLSQLNREETFQYFPWRCRCVREVFTFYVLLHFKSERRKKQTDVFAVKPDECKTSWDEKCTWTHSRRPWQPMRSITLTHVLILANT